eukprot:2440-Heterococcus_DN1.PRE.1
MAPTHLISAKVHANVQLRLCYCMVMLRTRMSVFRHALVSTEGCTEQAASNCVFVRTQMDNNSRLTLPKAPIPSVVNNRYWPICTAALA